MRLFAMKTKLIPLCAAAALGLLPLASADAPPLPGVAENPSAPEAKANQFQGKITSVDKDANMVTLDDKNLGSHQLHIDNSTKLTKGTEAATFDDLKVGAEIAGTCKKSGTMFHAETVKVSSSDEAK